MMLVVVHQHETLVPVSGVKFIMTPISEASFWSMYQGSNI